jgi:hypothetical protein
MQPIDKCAIAIILKTVCNDFDMLVAIEYHSYYAISQLQQNHAAISIITTNSYNVGFNVILLDGGRRAVKPHPCTRPATMHPPWPREQDSVCSRRRLRAARFRSGQNP